MIVLRFIYLPLGLIIRVWMLLPFSPRLKYQYIALSPVCVGVCVSVCPSFRPSQGQRSAGRRHQNCYQVSPEHLSCVSPHNITTSEWLSSHETWDVFCVVFRDSPVVQGNSILALSGLAAALAKYESNLPADEDGGLRVTRYVISNQLRHHCDAIY